MENLLGSALKILIGSDIVVENTNGCQHKYENSVTNKQFVFFFFRFLLRDVQKICHYMKPKTHTPGGEVIFFFCICWQLYLMPL